MWIAGKIPPKFNASGCVIKLLDALALVLLDARHMENKINNAMRPIGLRIPKQLHQQINDLAPFFKGGKSEIVRRSLIEGLRIVHETHTLSFPHQQNNANSANV